MTEPRDPGRFVTRHHWRYEVDATINLSFGLAVGIDHLDHDGNGGQWTFAVLLGPLFVMVRRLPVEDE